MTDEAKKCFAWIQDEYNINFELVEVNGKNIVDLVLEWHNKALKEKQEAGENKIKTQITKMTLKS